MNFLFSGMRGDGIFLIHFFEYFKPEQHTLILLNNPNLVSWPGHEHAGASLNDNDVKDFNELLSVNNIEVINRKEAEVRNITDFVDLNKWREYIELFNGNIIFAIARSLGLTPTNTKIDKVNGWLGKYTSPNIEDHRKIVINRSFRYRTNKFNYGLLKEYADKCVFIGSDKEYADFCKSYFNVERKLCDSLKEIIDYISGSSLFVGNHSMCHAIAVALAKPRLIESHRSNIDNYTNNGYDIITPALITTYLKG